MRRIYLLSALIMFICFGCQWHFRPSGVEDVEHLMSIERFDQTELLFLTTGDVAALQQMKTVYPMQTRTLIEDVIKLGYVSDADINTRFLSFFQDSTLQILMADVKREYADMTDVENRLDEAFARLQTIVPSFKVPRVYAQIGSLDQSIVVFDGMLGISLDKYLGKDYPLYLKYDYSELQRSTMTRQFIVPDCLSFYLISLYPLTNYEQATDDERHWHIAKIQYLANYALGQQVFSDSLVNVVAERFGDSDRPDADKVMSLSYQ